MVNKRLEKLVNKIAEEIIDGTENTSEALSVAFTVLNGLQGASLLGVVGEKMGVDFDE